jgi:hypothetical protein
VSKVLAAGHEDSRRLCKLLSANSVGRPYSVRMLQIWPVNPSSLNSRPAKKAPPSRKLPKINQAKSPSQHDLDVSGSQELDTAAQKGQSSTPLPYLDSSGHCSPPLVALGSCSATSYPSSPPLAVPRRRRVQFQIKPTVTTSHSDLPSYFLGRKCAGLRPVKRCSQQRPTSILKSGAISSEANLAHASGISWRQDSEAGLPSRLVQEKDFE